MNRALAIADVERARAWRDAAVADGWSIEPTYPNSEGVDRASRLYREGFQAQILTRTPEEGHPTHNFYNGSVHVWGPDGMAIRVRGDYSWEQLTADLRYCYACKADDVETHRVGFAGRCCAACLPEQRRIIETPGWCD